MLVTCKVLHRNPSLSGLRQGTLPQGTLRQSPHLTLVKLASSAGNGLSATSYRVVYI